MSFPYFVLSWQSEGAEISLIFAYQTDFYQTSILHSLKLHLSQKLKDFKSDKLAKCGAPNWIGISNPIVLYFPLQTVSLFILEYLVSEFLLWNEVDHKQRKVGRPNYCQKQIFRWVVLSPTVRPSSIRPSDSGFFSITHARKHTQIMYTHALKRID